MQICHILLIKLRKDLHDLQMHLSNTCKYHFLKAKICEMLNFHFNNERK